MPTTCLPQVREYRQAKRHDPVDRYPASGTMASIART